MIILKLIILLKNLHLIFRGRQHQVISFNLQKFTIFHMQILFISCTIFPFFVALNKIDFFFAYITIFSTYFFNTTFIIEWTAFVCDLCQFTWVIILKIPFLSIAMCITFQHQELLMITRYFQTSIGRLVMKLLRVFFVWPELESHGWRTWVTTTLINFHLNYLIAFTAMAWIENNISPCIVEARFVTSDFSRFWEHPVLFTVRKRQLKKKKL